MKRDREILWSSVSEAQVNRFHEIWDDVAPHPVVGHHPLLSIIGTAILLVCGSLYWYLGTPIDDIVYQISVFVSLFEAIWKWAIPTTIQSIFRTFPVVRLTFVLVIIALGSRAYNQGVGHLITEDIGKAASSLFSAIGNVPVILIGGLSSLISENREFLSDILSGLISSVIFKILIALGIVGAIVSFATGGF